MMPYYAVQARLIERRNGVVVRDETRLDTATRLDEALREGRRHAADGFTVWIYRVDDTLDVTPRYVAVQTLPPVPRPARTTGRTS